MTHGVPTGVTPAPGLTRGLLPRRGPGSSPGHAIALACVALLGITYSHPAAAKWHYCYEGTAPDGVNQYTEMPPRTFGFELALLPYAFKRLCNIDADPEGGHIWRLVRDDLQCTATSDFAKRIETVLDGNPAQLSQLYLDQTTLPDGPAWTQVCLAADAASIKNLAFADTWYFDSPDADTENAQLKTLLDALSKLSAALQAQKEVTD